MSNPFTDSGGQGVVARPRDIFAVSPDGQLAAKLPRHRRRAPRLNSTAVGRRRLVVVATLGAAVLACLSTVVCGRVKPRSPAPVSPPPRVQPAPRSQPAPPRAAESDHAPRTPRTRARRPRV